MEYTKRTPGRPPKPPEQRAESRITFRALRRDKARWTATAQRHGEKLSAWITETLNANSRFDDE